MAAAAPSTLASSVEKTNGAKLSRLLIDGGTTVLRKIFDGHHPPANLITDLNANYPILNNLLRRRVLNGHQWDKLFSPGGVAPDSQTFDITLLFLLLTYICGLTPPPSGWHTKPPPSDTSHEANLARVKFYRNILYGHVTTTGIDAPTFSALWTEISGVLVSLGLNQAEVDRLKAEKGGEQDYIDVLVEWANSEEDIKSQLRNIHQSQSQTHQAVEGLRQAQEELQNTLEDLHQTHAKTVEDLHQTHVSTQKAVEDLHQTQANTQKRVEDIHQTQAKTQMTVKDLHQTQASTKKTVEDIHQTQAKTQKTVEDIHQTHAKTQKTVEDIQQTHAKTQKPVEKIRQTQTETHQNIEEVHQTMEEVLQTQVKTQHTIEEVRHENAKNVDEVAEGLKEIMETVESLKEKRDEEKADKVLRSLAKSEFSGDIEYHLQRFQEGTRDWVFETVQNWLDDRSSQNRVMVISGNAGMGKSVIAAAICQRMQEVGRLSGSHFCQYNNVRYRKPQLMIHSLACHLSHALPDYKQVLVDQLSRNLGTDLNNMGVEELFALLFKEPLCAVGDPGRNMLMVIDGLDESEYHGRNELLDVIANQFCKLPIWIRFLVTTRPALNIAEKLKKLKPFELKSNDEKNLEDIRIFCLKRLEHVVKLENVGEFIERLVLKSEGLMLYADFLISSITENASIFHEEDLDDNFPLGISSVYHCYFKRLERELVKELNITGEHFLNLLSAIAVSREPLPVGFVSKLLELSSNSKLAKRKVLTVLSSVSALLPIRDGCLHVIHKSVKDWLTDISCYGEHEFITDENEGHRTLAALCTDELDMVKRNDVHNTTFSATEKYALYHGAHHMLHEGVKIEPHKLDELTKAYITDLEIVYAKTCVDSAILAAEDLLWLKKQGISTLLSRDNQSILDTLLFLLRKYLRRLKDTPRAFLQTVLNQGGKVLTVEASNLLRKKYPEIPYMEDIHKERLPGGVVARFDCSSDVICLDVSPQLDFMVCECNDGMLQLWSLYTGRLVWTRPVVIEKCFTVDKFFKCARNLPRVDVISLFRSVVFHPTKECILPGILSHAYTMDGDFKPLFPGSNCRFSVCSVSGDKTKILTNCLENSKRLVLWSLENGSEVNRIIEDEDVLSFAWSGDGRLLAISHSSGVISLVDVMNGFIKLAETVAPDVCGMVKFSPDHQFLRCCFLLHVVSIFFCLRVVKETHNTFSLQVCRDVSYDLMNFESFNDCGFLLGDLITTDELFDHLTFALGGQRLLKCIRSEIEMVDTKGVNKVDQGQSTMVTGIAISLDGQTVYVASNTSVTAWDAFNRNLKAKINREFTPYTPLCPVRGGVLFSTKESTVELWDYDLYECIKVWTKLPSVEQLIPMSETRVAVARKREVKVLDTCNGEIVSILPAFYGDVVTCNSKCQLLTAITSGSYQSSLSDVFQLYDGATVIWRKEGIGLGSLNQCVAFSPTEQFIIVGSGKGMFVLDAKTGNTLRTPWPFSFRHCAFISDDQCIVSGFRDVTVQLLNVKSGELLNAMEVESNVTCLAACPFNRLLAIGLQNSIPNFKVIKVHLPGGEGSGNAKRATSEEVEGSDAP